MSFKKRKTAYRKAVAASVFDQYPLPQENEKIARILIGRGGNVFEVNVFVAVNYRWSFQTAISSCLSCLPSLINSFG